MKEKLHELLDLCLEINEGERFYAFYEFHGHVNNLSIRVTLKDTQVWVAKGNLYLDHEENPEKRLGKLYNNLTQFLDPELKLEYATGQKVMQSTEYKEIAL